MRWNAHPRDNYRKFFKKKRERFPCCPKLILDYYYYYVCDRSLACNCEGKGEGKIRAGIAKPREGATLVNANTDISMQRK